MVELPNGSTVSFHRKSKAQIDKYCGGLENWKEQVAKMPQFDRWMKQGRIKRFWVEVENYNDFVYDAIVQEGIETKKVKAMIYS